MNCDCQTIARDRGDLAGAETCAAAREHLGCSETVFCPVRRLFEKWERWGIPLRERRLLQADLLGTKLLEPRAALRAVREALTVGDRALVVLAGKCGAGKTVAASWALSRRGGLYTRACEFTRIGFDMDAMVKANVLVIDQLGTEPMTQSEWALGQFLDVIDARYAALRLTVLCANMSRESLEKRYTQPFARRLRDDGVFVRVGHEVIA
jgi:hypothetical protein